MNMPGDKNISESIAALNLDVSKLVVFIASFLYGTGYLIQAITLRNYGLTRLESIKFQYIEVGITFTVLLLMVTVVPLGCYLAHTRTRRESSLPHYRYGAYVYLVNTYNLFLIVAFFALFITMQEMTSVIIDIGVLGIYWELQKGLILYLAIGVSALIFLPILERIVVRKNRSVKTFYYCIIEPIRTLAALSGILFDVMLLLSFPWLITLITRGLAFFLSALLLMAAVIAIGYYMRRLGDRRNLHAIAGVGIMGVFVVVYIVINAYVFSVVRHIPMNRGGKLPVNQYVLATNSSVPQGIPIVGNSSTGDKLIGPLYIINESQDYIHVANISKQEWFIDWVHTYSLRKESIQYINSERLAGSGPRTP